MLFQKTRRFFYFAQPIANGHQIVNNGTKVMRHTQYITKMFFIGVRGDTRGWVIIKEGKWLFEYYENDFRTVKVEVLVIIFISSHLFFKKLAKFLFSTIVSWVV